VRTGPSPEGAGYWFQTAYGDYLRNFSSALGASPAWAPPGEAHIVRSSSVISHVVTSETGVLYTSFLPDSIEVVRVPFRPATVTAGGAALPLATDLTAAGYMVETLADGDFVVRVRHVTSGEVALVAPTQAGSGCSVGDSVPDGRTLGGLLAALLVGCA